MKNHFVILSFKVLVSLLISSINAQTGLYLTPVDYSINKLSYPNSKIKLHESFYKPFVEVKTQDSIFKLNKKDIFGYSNKDGINRLFKDESYPVINPFEKILLYKKTTGTGGKGSSIIDTYYFSKDAASNILQLTIRNIETVFASDAKFEKLLEIHFTKDSDLREYDELHKMYKLNRLYELSKQ